MFWPDVKNKGKFALVTMIKNDLFFLEYWINHYAKYLKADFYIIDHSSEVDIKEWGNDKYSTLNINVLKIPDISFEDRFKSSALSSIANLLSGCYEVVIASDVDEIVIPVDKATPLSDVIMNSDSVHIAPIGMEFIHRSEFECSFKLDCDVESQRIAMFLTSGYTKPVIWKNQAEFTPGQHGLNQKYIISANLCLVHLRSIDIGQTKLRQVDRNSTKFSDEQEGIFGNCPWKKNIDDKTWYGNWIFAKANSFDLEYGMKCERKTLQEFSESIEIKKYGENYKHNISIVSDLMVYSV